MYLTTGDPDIVCDLRFQTFKKMYENASKIALNKTYILCDPGGGGGVLRYISDGDVRMRQNC